MTKEAWFRHAKAALVGLSLANICLLPSWSALLYSTNVTFFAAADVSINSYWACLADFLLLAVAFWFLVEIWMTSPKGVLKTVAGALLFLGALEALNNIRGFFPFLIFPVMVARYGRAPVLAASLIAAAAIGAVAIKFHRKILPAMIELLAVISLSVFVNVAGVAGKMKAIVAHPPSTFAARHEMKPSDRRRVVWIIFDEFDARLALRERPAGLIMPNLDDLVSHSLVGTEATSPTSATLTSIPSLLTGKLVLDSHEKGAADLMVTLDGEPAAKSIKTMPQFFSEAYVAGHNTAAVGWYIPYCRLFGDSLTSCASYGFFDPDTAEKTTAQEMRRQLRNVNSIKFEFLRTLIGEKTGWSWMLPESNVDWVRRYRKILSAALTAVGDKGTDAVYLHFSIPHFPVIYDRATSSLSSSGAGTYIDNLALVDKTLGEIMKQMKYAGTWDQTALLVSSDHWFRFRADESDLFVGGSEVDRHVPFVLKLPAAANANASAPATAPVYYSKPFNTIATKDLLLSILGGHVTTAKDVTSWLEKNAVDRSPFQGPVLDRLSSHHAP